MTRLIAITITTLAVFSITAGVDAQTATTQQSTGDKQMSNVSTITGAVDWVVGNRLLIKLTNGDYQFFDVPADRQFFIDGKPRLVGDLQLGTVLTATVITHSRPVTERTTTVTNGTIWYVSGNYVVVTLENGENRDYVVPPEYRFTVEGKPASVNELKKGMKVSATKIVEQPKTELSTTVVVSGTSPKK
jgi:hypothetical protein